MSTASDTTRNAVVWLKRLWPLLLLARRDGVRARHGLAALPHAPGAGREPGRAARLYRRQYAARACSPSSRSMPWSWRCRCPGGAVLTLAGGFLFGWLIGGIASIIGATHRRRHRLSHCQERPERSAGRSGRPLALPLSPGIPARRLQLSAILAARADLSVLAGQSGAWTARGRLLPPMSSPPYWASSRELLPIRSAGSGLDSVIAAQQAAHQSCLAKMGPGGQEFLPVYARSGGAFDAGADCWARGAGARGARSGGGQMVQAHGAA